MSRRVYEVHMEMAPLSAFRPSAGRMSLFKKDSDAPDYSEMAAASDKAAELGYQLGTAQLDESKRQYEDTMAVAKPIIEAQTGLMSQSIAQGDDYYNYMKANQRPVEQALQADAMAAGTEAKQNEAAAQAEADSLAGFTKSGNILARQGARYGLSSKALGAANTGLSADMASKIAAATGAARTKEEATGYAKKMDVAGLYRNLTGASQGSYGLALNAGNSATQNQMAPGAQLQSGMAQGSNTIMAGQQQKMNGLSSIINSQTALSGSTDNTGALIGALGGMGAAWLKAPSDRRLKEKIVKVGVDEKTGLNLYEFNYIGGDARYRGVMADEVMQVMPDAVQINADGYASVNYAMLGLTMEQVS